MVMIELSESEMPPPLPPPTFSAPFATPTLRWACKKRLRSLNHDAASPVSATSSPSPSRSPLRPGFPPLDIGGTSKCAATLPHLRGKSPLPPPSDRPRVVIRLPIPRREDGGGEPSAPPPPTDLSSVAPTGAARGGEGEAVARSLRSRSRAGDENGKRTRRVELWVPLSRDEIEEDFLRMTGSKPPRRCRRRSGAGSDHLNGIFPGSWLPNRITADYYQVAEPSNPRKV